MCYRALGIHVNVNIKLTGSLTVNVSLSTYVCDGLDRLRIITRYTWDAGSSEWTQQSQKKFVYDGMQAIQERDGDNNVTATNIWDGNIGGLEARVVYDIETPANPPQKYFYHYDGSGNVTAVTDGTQQTVAQYEYDAYGNLINSNGAYALQNPWRFSTKYFDDGSGLYYYGYRFYSPGLGKWINRDPIAESGGLNLYGFVGNGPNNALDAYGFSQDMGGGSGTVRFSFATYIPYAKAHAPLGYVFKGDSRGPSWNSTRYRTQLNGVIDLKNHTVHFGTPGIGSTHEYTTNWTGTGTYDPGYSWCKKSWGYEINISGGAQNPFYQHGPINTSLAIHHRVTFSFDNNGNFLGANGDRGGFPSMELWTYKGAAGTPHLAYNFDVRELGRTNPLWLGNNERF